MALCVNAGLGGLGPSSSRVIVLCSRVKDFTFTLPLYTQERGNRRIIKET